MFTYLFTFYLVIYLFIFTLTFKCLTGQWHVLIQDRKGYDYEQVVIDIIFSVALTFGLEQSIFPFKFLLNLCILYQKVSVKIPCKYTKMKLIFGLAPKILFFPICLPSGRKMSGPIWSALYSRVIQLRGKSTSKSAFEIYRRD